MTPEKAAENFQATFYKDIAGTWEFERTNAEAVIIHILDNGSFVFGQATPTDHAGQAGIELGQLNWQAPSSSISPSFTLDTNGEWGFSHPIGVHTLNFDGTNLVCMKQVLIKPINSRVQQSSGLVGTWKLSETQLFAFFDNNHYFFLDGQGSVGDEDCGLRGIEYGKLSITTNALALTEILYDTNGCAGFYDPWDKGKVHATYSISGTSLTMHPQGETLLHYNVVTKILRSSLSQT